MKTLDALRKAGQVETNMKTLRLQHIIKTFSEFKDDPEVAKAIDYIERYAAEPPPRHPIWEYVHGLKQKKEEVALREKERKVRRGISGPVGENVDEKTSARFVAEFNKLADNAEASIDALFAFIDSNGKRMLASVPMHSVVKSRRVVFSMKGLVKTVRIK